MSNDPQRMTGLLAAEAAASDPLRCITDALLTAAGYCKHHRANGE